MVRLIGAFCAVLLISPPASARAPSKVALLIYDQYYSRLSEAFRDSEHSISPLKGLLLEALELVKQEVSLGSEPIVAFEEEGLSPKEAQLNILFQQMLQKFTLNRRSGGFNCILEDLREAVIFLHGSWMELDEESIDFLKSRMTQKIGGIRLNKNELILPPSYSFLPVLAELPKGLAAQLGAWFEVVETRRQQSAVSSSSVTRFLGVLTVIRQCMERGNVRPDVLPVLADPVLGMVDQSIAGIQRRVLAASRPLNFTIAAQQANALLGLLPVLIQAFSNESQLTAKQHELEKWMGTKASSLPSPALKSSVNCLKALK